MQLELITSWGEFDIGDRIAYAHSPDKAIGTISDITQGKVFLKWDSCPTSDPTGFPKFRFKPEFVKAN